MDADYTVDGKEWLNSLTALQRLFERGSGAIADLALELAGDDVSPRIAAWRQPSEPREAGAAAPW